LSAASAERPHLITSSTARAAPARAGAPGAQGVLAKLPPGEGHTVRIVAYGDLPAPGALHVGHAQAAPTASNAHEVIVYGDDHARIGAFIAFCRVVIVQRRRGLQAPRGASRWCRSRQWRAGAAAARGPCPDPRPSA